MKNLEPYYIPIKDTLKRILGSGNADYFIRRKIIEFRPVAFMRGSTFQDSIIILDEAQNLTPVQMKMFLTRIGENCKVIINGDMTQQDIKGMSGLMDAVKRLRGIRRVAIIEFSLNDVVRSGIVKDILRAYS
jgi:phosphate starvation-inducible PhoH-like protein